jgi:ADP-ribose pyrophosphatase
MILFIFSKKGWCSMSLDKLMKDNVNSRVYTDGIKKLTDNRFLNMYEADGVDCNGRHFPYYFTSRKTEDKLVAYTGNLEPEGAVIFAVRERDGEDCLVLVKQYRFPVNMNIYEVPAGLIDKGEGLEEAAIREFREETGMRLNVYKGGEDYFRNSFIQAQGICDECNAVVFGYAEGEVSSDRLEDTEAMEVVIADRTEVRRILREEPVALRGAYLMMMFLMSEPGNPFSFMDKK